MKSYFEWSAMFDDTIPNIGQFEENGKENPFKEVEDNKDKLVKFKIEAEDGEFYEVDLINGTINCNGKITEEIISKKGDKIGLIYSRRNQVRGEVGTGKLLDARTIHRIGLRYGNQEKVIEVFPGLKMAERKIVLKDVDLKSKEGTAKDITKALKKE